MTITVHCRECQRFVDLSAVELRQLWALALRVECSEGRHRVVVVSGAEAAVERVGEEK